MAPSFLPSGQKVWIQSENGILGMGDYPLPDAVDPYVSLNALLPTPETDPIARPPHTAEPSRLTLPATS
jgi:3-oxoacid CoA-transferase